MITLGKLNEIKDSVAETYDYTVVVGMATCGVAAGASDVFARFDEIIAEISGQKVLLTQTGCIGLCRLEPMVDVIDKNGRKTTYTKVNAEIADMIIENHIMKGDIFKENSVDDVKILFHKQERVALSNCGTINPEVIDDYIKADGYKALSTALLQMTREEVLAVIKDSGLRGRGGGGFPTGTKWEFAKKYENEKKYVVCNADEGDPGAFMDRSVLEGDPHSVIEAMTIAGYVIGADEGYIYIRAEYPLAINRLKIAIAQANEYGLLGKNIFGTDFSFKLNIRYGAGAFVCGEETALLNSIEGMRGTPRLRPPFPAEKGLFDRPTILNNVETYANVPKILRNGAGWFNSMGTETSKGTKVFALGGNVHNVGLAEVAMGITLREIVYEIGGGIPDGREFKAAQTGGPSGGCIPAQFLDTPIDYETLKAIGSMMGSGGLIVMDDTKCMVGIAKFFMEFMVEESCGKCTPCRIGVKRMHEILEKITGGEGTMQDLSELEALADLIANASICGLGQTAANPVKSTLMYFRDEYLAHINEKRCPAGECAALLIYEINDLCIGCGACKKACPTGCITGKIKERHVIDHNRCIKCGSCKLACKFKAIDVK